MINNTVIFALTSSVDLANEIAQQVGIPLGSCDVRHFADGEILVQLGESVRGKNVYIVQSTCNPVSSTLMELLIAIDACKRASAAFITAVIPYYGYARQDRKARPRQPITSKLVATLLETAGADHVITMDLHATQIQGFFDVPADDLSCVQLISEYFESKKLENVVVVSPDHGGIARARALAENLNAPIAIIDKRRPKPNVAEAMNIIGDVDGKVAVLVDDIVDTAGTLVAGVDLLYKMGAKEVYASCTHGVLSGPAIERLRDSKITEFVCTNTIPQAAKAANLEKMTVLTVGKMLGEVIKGMEDHRSVSDVLKSFNK